MVGVPPALAFKATKIARTEVARKTHDLCVLHPLKPTQSFKFDQKLEHASRTVLEALATASKEIGRAHV